MVSPQADSHGHRDGSNPRAECVARAGACLGCTASRISCRDSSAARNRVGVTAGPRFPNLAEFEAAFVLGYDPVLDGGDCPDRRWYIIPRPKLGVGVAVGGSVSLGNQFRTVARFFVGTAPRRFASVSVLLALVSAIAPTKDLVSQWRHYQHLYVQLIHNRPDAARLEHRFQRGIHQIWIPEQRVVDRCTTCHVALQDTTLAAVRKAALRP